MEKHSDTTLLLYQGIIDTIHEPLLVLDEGLNILFASRSFYSTFNVTPADTIGNRIYDIGNRQWNNPELRELLNETLTKNKEFTINLIEGEKKKWLQHRNNTEVDVVLIPIQIDRTKFFVVPLNKSFIETGNVQVGIEKIYIMGYPFGWYDKVNNLPITRVGHLSSPFKVPFLGKQVMLGDIETHKGMSGGPVFMKLEDYTEIIDGKPIKRMGATKTILLGIHSGKPLWELSDKKSGKKTLIHHTLVNIWFADLILDILH